MSDYMIPQDGNYEGTGSSWVDAKAGLYRAVVVKVWDAGFQRPFGDNADNPCLYCAVVDFEIDCPMPAGQGQTAGGNYIVSKQYDMAFHWKPSGKSTALKHLAEAANGGELTPDQLKTFDVRTLEGKCVHLDYGLSNKGKIGVRSTRALSRGTAPMESQYLVKMGEPTGLAKFILGKSVGEAEAAKWNERISMDLHGNRVETKADVIPF
jgi:hypothetical protein